MRERIDLDFDGVKIYEHADALNGHTPVQGEALAAINEGVTEVYDAFIVRVAEGRGMTVEGVNEVARGRVWTGQDAMDIGLVDGMRNLQDAGPRGDPAGINGPELVELPEAVDPFEQFIEDFAGVQAAGPSRRPPASTATRLPCSSRWRRWYTPPPDRIQARMPYTIRHRCGGHRATMDGQAATPEAFAAAGKLPLRFVLDNPRSLNVGSVFRTADAFRLEGIDVCGYMAARRRDILKTASGPPTIAWRAARTR